MSIHDDLSGIVANIRERRERLAKLREQRIELADTISNLKVEIDGVLLEIDTLRTQYLAMLDSAKADAEGGGLGA